MEALDFTGFRSLILEDIGEPELTSFGPETRLEEDLGLDSLGTLELIVRVECLAGSNGISTKVPAIFTLGQAFEYYLSTCRELEGSM